jgi:hypothetical protein
MRLGVALAVALVLGWALPVLAQEQPPVFNVGTTEWMVTAGPGFGVAVFHSVPGHRYFLQPLSWGRILTPPRGPGPLRGQFEWSFELVPVFGQYNPQGTYGFGVTPLLWRWNFTPRGRISPFAELAGGALWTRNPVPAQTTTANFTAHASYGLRYFVRPHLSVVASYRFHHISNGNRLDRNPGVNANVAQLGVSVMRPR